MRVKLLVGNPWPGLLENRVGSSRPHPRDEVVLDTTRLRPKL
jgi:hypothetical protein